MQNSVSTCKPDSAASSAAPSQNHCSNYQPNIIQRHAALRQRPHRRLALQPRPCHGLSYPESSSPLLPKFSATTGRPSPVRRAWPSHDSESNSPPRSNYQPNVIQRHAALRQRPHRRLALQPRPCHGLRYRESSSPLLSMFSATAGRPSPVRRAWQSPQSLGHHRVTDTTS